MINQFDMIELLNEVEHPMILFCIFYDSRQIQILLIYSIFEIIRIFLRLNFIYNSSNISVCYVLTYLHNLSRSKDNVEKLEQHFAKLDARKISHWSYQHVCLVKHV